VSRRSGRAAGRGLRPRPGLQLARITAALQHRAARWVRAARAGSIAFRCHARAPLSNATPVHRFRPRPCIAFAATPVHRFRCHARAPLSLPRPCTAFAATPVHRFRMPARAPHGSHRTEWGGDATPPAERAQASGSRLILFGILFLRTAKALEQVAVTGQRVFIVAALIVADPAE
jgi:hypothetical protein